MANVTFIFGTSPNTKPEEKKLGEPGILYLPTLKSGVTRPPCPPPYCAHGCMKRVFVLFLCCNIFIYFLNDFVNAREEWGRSWNKSSCDQSIQSIDWRFVLSCLQDILSTKTLANRMSEKVCCNAEWSIRSRITAIRVNVISPSFLVMCFYVAWNFRSTYIGLLVNSVAQITKVYNKRLLLQKTKSHYKTVDRNLQTIKTAQFKILWIYFTFVRNIFIFFRIFTISKQHKMTFFFLISYTAIRNA